MHGFCSSTQDLTTFLSDPKFEKLCFCEKKLQKVGSKERKHNTSPFSWQKRLRATPKTFTAPPEFPFSRYLSRTRRPFCSPWPAKRKDETLRGAEKGLSRSFYLNKQNIWTGAPMPDPSECELSFFDARLRT